MIVINSKDNKILKEIIALKTKKGRQKSGRFFIEGEKIIKEVIQTQIEIDKLVISEYVFKRIEEFGYIKNINNLIVLKDYLFDKVSDTVNPQGVIAILKKPTYEVDDLFKRISKVVILDGLQDPGNVGTIIRTADAVVFDAVILINNTVEYTNPKVIRSTMGSFLRIPIIENISNQKIFDLLKLNNINIMATHLSAKKNLYEINYSDKIGIIVGNESKGISNECISHSDFLVKIPMPGKAESLNVSVAASILMYETVRNENL